MSIVLDASVAVAWLFDEERPAWIDGMVSDALGRTGRLSVPTLFWLEIGNRLAQDATLTDAQAMDGMLRIESLAIHTHGSDRPSRLLALQLARSHRLTMYHATYLALSDTTRSPLATLDRQLDDAAASMGLSYARPDHRLSEPSAAYIGASDSASLASIGAGLAALRKRYATS